MTTKGVDEMSAEQGDSGVAFGSDSPPFCDPARLVHPPTVRGDATVSLLHLLLPRSHRNHRSVAPSERRGPIWGLPACRPAWCLMISRCAVLLHHCDWLAIGLSRWNAGTGRSPATPSPSSLPTSSRGSAVCNNCPWGGREGGSGLLSSTLDMCPSSSSSQP